METNSNRIHIPYAPTESADLYPDSDGKPMAVSDLHRRILIRTLQVLDTYFAKNPAAYVSGDILMYYVEGDPRQSVSPDVLVTFGLDKENRRTYLVWEEGKVPDFVMEFSSKSTYRNDLGRKMTLYASLGIQDYFLYDAEGLYLSSPLMGFTLVEGSYVPISAGPDQGLHSAALGLDFYAGDIIGLGIYDPVAGDWLQTPEESAIARANREAARAEQEIARADREAARAEQETARAELQTMRADMAETLANEEAARAEQEAARAAREAARAKQETARANEEAATRQKAEAELAELREALERLKART